MPPFFTFNSVIADVAWILLHFNAFLLATFEGFMKYGRFTGAKLFNPFIWIVVVANTTCKYAMELSERDRGEDDEVGRLSRAELITVIIFNFTTSIILWFAASGQVETVKRRIAITRVIGSSSTTEQDEDTKFVTPIQGEVAYYSKKPEAAQSIAEMHTKHRLQSASKRELKEIASRLQELEGGGQSENGGSSKARVGCAKAFNAVRYMFVDTDPLPYRAKSESTCDVLDCHLRWIAVISGSHSGIVASSKLYGLNDSRLPVQQSEMLFILLFVIAALYAIYHFFTMLLDPRKFEIVRTFVGVPAFFTLAVFGVLYEALSNGGVTSLENNILGISSLILYSGWFVCAVTLALTIKRVKIE